MVHVTRAPAGYSPQPVDTPEPEDDGSGGLIGTLLGLGLVGGGGFWLKQRVFMTAYAHESPRCAHSRIADFGWGCRDGLKFQLKKPDLFAEDGGDDSIYADQPGMDLETL